MNDDDEEEEEEEEEGGGLRDPVRACKMYVQKRGKCCRVRAKGNGLYLSPHPPHSSGDGLYLKAGRTLYDGRGLLHGPNSPVKDIPLLYLLL